MREKEKKTANAVLLVSSFFGVMYAHSLFYSHLHNSVCVYSLHFVGGFATAVAIDAR